MQMFDMVRATDPQAAIAGAAASSTAQGGASVRFLAGGTNLIDLMKLGVETPDHVVDIHRLPLGAIEPDGQGGLRIGATATNTEVAHHTLVRDAYPALSEAILAGASTQLRNAATTAGNLLQRTRCGYFRDRFSACNKREPGTGCDAIGGANRSLAILGTSDHCIATHPSDMAVAMMAYGASISIEGPNGARTVPIEAFYRLPGDTPEIETVLEPGDLITGVTLPDPGSGARGTYLKLRDRASYHFALVSAAVSVAVSDGAISSARFALGGVGTMPWRVKAAEAILVGQAPDDALFRRAAARALEGAVAQSQNGFKVELATRCLVHALGTVTAAANA